MKDKATKTTEKSSKSRLSTALLLAMLAIVAISAASYAWMSISKSTKVSSMSLDITTGHNLRVDLEAHDAFGDYRKSVTYEAVSSYIENNYGYSMDTPLDPVTTTDYSTFYLEDGTEVDPKTGKYMEFTLHFMATEDMTVHLTSENSHTSGDGTSISSSHETLPAAMRVSFTANGTTKVYNPRLADTISEDSSIIYLPKAEEMVYNEQNSLFALKANVDQPLTVRIWMEGTDPACEDSLKSADFAIRIRFLGTDANNEKFYE